MIKQKGDQHMFTWVKNLFGKKDQPLVLTDPIIIKEEPHTNETSIEPTPTKSKRTANKKAPVEKTTEAPKKRGRKPKT